MKVIVNAANVHQGGGRTLLLGLLAALRQPAIAVIDARLCLPTALPDYIQTVIVQPTIASRFSAERRIMHLCEPGDLLICFGNLPPLFKSPAQVFVYLHNRYLTSSRSLSGLHWRSRARIIVERLWLRACLRDATILVQTPSMAQEVLSKLGRTSRVAPFVPATAAPNPDGGPKEYDFLYVASGEIHKNHRRLVDAWVILAAQGHYPSLRLTLDATRDRELVRWIAARTSTHSLRITYGEVSHEAVANLYMRSTSLIYPSLFESFGLPLIEADRAGLAILAAERDYVRDVVMPAASFDPDSAVSIARAVLRHLRIGAISPNVMTPEDFLASIVPRLHS